MSKFYDIFKKILINLAKQLKFVVIMTCVNQGATLSHIWIPGDNDIGGEGYDRVTQTKVRRFDDAFAQPDVIPHRNLTFYKINRFTQTLPKVPTDRDFYNTDKLVIGLSHMPLLFQPAVFVDDILSKLQPHLLLTAHEHKSMVVSIDSVLRQDRQIIPIIKKDVFTFTLGARYIYEVLVPSCSYRMGSFSIGFGYLVIENDVIRYTMLWSPSRYHNLTVYILVIFILLYLMCQMCCSRSRCRSRNKYELLPINKSNKDIL